jgi:hypothetical protein
VRQVLLLILLQALTFALVPALRLRQHVPCCQLQNCAGLSVHLRVYAITEKLGRHGHGRELHQPDTAVHGHFLFEYGRGYLVSRTACSHGSEFTNATGAEIRPDLYLWRWSSVSTVPSARGLQSDENRTCITSGVSQALLFPMLKSTDMT